MDKQLYLIAKSERQLGIGLKFLYTQKIECHAIPFEMKLNRIGFKIFVNTTEERYEELQKQFAQMIS